MDYESSISMHKSDGYNTLANSEVHRRPEDPEIQQIHEWIIRRRISQDVVDKLLGILKPRLLSNIPKSSKTLLKTMAAKYIIENMEDASSERNGQFVYLDLKDQLINSIDTNFFANR